MEISKLKILQDASADFRYLLNRGYPRKSALELVGNRYGLTSDERHLLHRGVFSDFDATSRKKKRIPPKKILNHDLAIDGHNVLITIEAGLTGRPLILGDDGFVRDISGLSGSFKKSEVTQKALSLIIQAIKRIKPNHTLILFDAPISMSGRLAQEVKNAFNKERISGEAIAVKVPEKILIGFSGVVATSDTAIVDQSKKVFDLAGYILKQTGMTDSVIRFSRKQEIASPV